MEISKIWIELCNDFCASSNVLPITKCSKEDNFLCSVCIITKYSLEGNYDVLLKVVFILIHNYKKYNFVLTLLGRSLGSQEPQKIFISEVFEEKSFSHFTVVHPNT